jgi:hypothetical protein
VFTGRYIMVPLLTAECSNLEPSPQFIPSPCTDDTSCRVCAKTLANMIIPSSLKASVDGVPVSALTRTPRSFRVQSLCSFSIFQRETGLLPKPIARALVWGIRLVTDIG